MGAVQNLECHPEVPKTFAVSEVDRLGKGKRQKHTERNPATISVQRDLTPELLL